MGLLTRPIHISDVVKYTTHSEYPGFFTQLKIRIFFSLDSKLVQPKN